MVNIVKLRALNNNDIDKVKHYIEDIVNAESQLFEQAAVRFDTRNAWPLLSNGSVCCKR